MTDSANVALVRSIYADWERGAFGATHWADPDIEYIVVGGLAPGQWNGLSSMREAARAIFMEGWDGPCVR
jgi:hypothetical protein